MGASNSTTRIHNKVETKKPVQPTFNSPALVTRTQSFYVENSECSFTLHFSMCSQERLVSNVKNVQSADTLLHVPSFAGSDSSILFGMYCGHGEHGHAASRFAADHVPQNLQHFLKSNSYSKKTHKYESFDNMTNKDIEQSIIEAYVDTHREMEIEPMNNVTSGTTACTLIVSGRNLHIGNAGHSRVILGTTLSNSTASHTRTSMNMKEKEVVGIPLSSDHTPFHTQERKRVTRNRGVVMTLDQIEGRSPLVEDNDLLKVYLDGDAPRIWNETQDGPGCRFTRALGDAFAGAVGVICVPEVTWHYLEPEDRFLVIANSGVLEFLSSEAIAQKVNGFSDPLLGCKAVLAEAYQLWLQFDVTVESLAIVVIKIEKFELKGATVPRFILGGTRYPFVENRPVRRSFGRTKRQVASSVYAKAKRMGNLEVYRREKSEKEVEAFLAMTTGTLLFSHLNTASKTQLFQHCERKVARSGEYIIYEGDRGENLYLVESGVYEVIKEFPNGRAEVVHIYDTPGSYFGDLALMFGTISSLSVRTAESGILWAFPKEVFRAFLIKSIDSISRFEILQSMPQMNHLNYQQLQKVTDSLQEEYFSDGENILTEGTHGECFYLIAEGRVLVTKKGPNGDEYDLTSLPSDDGKRHFGERALLEGGDVRTASIWAIGDVILLTMGGSLFRELIGNSYIQDKQQYSENEMRARMEAYKDSPREISFFVRQLREFTFSQELRLWGQGGMVGRFRDNMDGSLKSIKLLQKVAYLDQVAFKRFSRELWIMKNLAKFPLDTALINLFVGLVESADCVGYVMQLDTVCCINTLRAAQDQMSFSEECAAFYVACVLSALQALHEASVVNRGISGLSILIDRAGYAVVSEFHCATFVTRSELLTMCGNLCYRSPEMLSGEHYDHLTDLWSLAVLGWELCAGYLPFGMDSLEEFEPDVVKDLVLDFTKGGTDIPRLRGNSPECHDLLNRLLRPAKTRLGRIGTGDVKKHPWFKAIDWDAVANRTFPPPEATGFSNFTRVHETEELPIDFIEPGAGYEVMAVKKDDDVHVTVKKDGFVFEEPRFSNDEAPWARTTKSKMFRGGGRRPASDSLRTSDLE